MACYANVFAKLNRANYCCYYCRVFIAKSVTVIMLLLESGVIQLNGNTAAIGYDISIQ